MGQTAEHQQKKKDTDSQLILKKPHLQSNQIQICVVIHLYSLQTNKQSKDGICRSHSIFRNGNNRDYVRNENPRNDNNLIEDGIRRHFGDNMVDLIYWKDIKKSAVVAASSLFLLISLSIFSVLSVISYISLAVLTVTFSYAVYKRTLAAVQKSSDGHPFGQYWRWIWPLARR